MREGGLHTDTVTQSVCTCSDDLLDLHAGELYLLGELPDGLVGVLVGEGVDVDLHAGRHWAPAGQHTSYSWPFRVPHCGWVLGTQLPLYFMNVV